VSKYYKIIKNKYFISTILVLFYILFLHNTDIVALKKRKDRVKQLQSEILLKRNEIIELKKALNELENQTTLEKFAREKYYFKKDNEDVFVLTDK
jgi:cell division protein FtsB